VRPKGISEDCQVWWGCTHEFEDDAAGDRGATRVACPRCGGDAILTYAIVLRFRGRYDSDGLPILE